MAEKYRTVARIEQELKETLEQEPRFSGLLRQTFEAKVAELKAELERRQADAASRRLLLQATKDMVDKDEATFWFRRFLLALGIANAAAFASVAGGVMGAKDAVLLQKIAAEALFPIQLFGFGAITAGLIPLVLWLRANVPALVALLGGLLHGDLTAAVIGARTGTVWLAGALASLSSGCFVVGVLAAANAVGELGK